MNQQGSGGGAVARQTHMEETKAEGQVTRFTQDPKGKGQGQMVSCSVSHFPPEAPDQGREGRKL